MKKLVWRIRYTLQGQRRTMWGYRLWWTWSASAFESCDGFAVTPEEAADDEIYYACT